MPKQKPSFEELIRSKEITFHSYGRKLKTKMKSFGEYNWDLIRKLIEQSGNKMILSGSALECYLQKPQNMGIITDFAMQIFGKGSERYGDFSVCVSVDIDALNPYYLAKRNSKEEKIVNLLGQTLADTSWWVKEIPYVEKVWNFSLCNALGGMVGSPGYEYPHTEKRFRAEMAWFAQRFMIGTPEQIKRYETYALNYLKQVFEKISVFEENPHLLFENTFEMNLLEIAAHDAGLVAENVVHFSKEWKRK
ncbi:hypothetical protein HYX13_04495 [Candidatus Woesearchaeota archaeon]|nr:hypothetical protein [Candidatus Woesearchaeota archaeon]